MLTLRGEHFYLVVNTTGYTCSMQLSVRWPFGAAPRILGCPQASYVLQPSDRRMQGRKRAIVASSGDQPRGGVCRHTTTPTSPLTSFLQFSGYRTEKASDINPQHPTSCAPSQRTVGHFQMTCNAGLCRILSSLSTTSET